MKSTNKLKIQFDGDGALYRLNVKAKDLEIAAGRNLKINVPDETGRFIVPTLYGTENINITFVGEGSMQNMTVKAAKRVTITSDSSLVLTNVTIEDCMGRTHIMDTTSSSELGFIGALFSDSDF